MLKVAILDDYQNVSEQFELFHLMGAVLIILGLFLSNR